MQFWRVEQLTEQLLEVLRDDTFRCPQYECTNRVQVVKAIEMGDFGSVLGVNLELKAECATEHHLNDDHHNYHAICNRYAERVYLLNKITGITNRAILSIRAGGDL